MQQSFARHSEQRKGYHDISTRRNDRDYRFEIFRVL